MHAPDSGSVAVECVQALAILRIPDFQGAVGAAANDDGARHLRGPNSANVTHQHSQTLLEHKRLMKSPGFQVIREHTFPVTADQTLSVLSSDPLSILLSENWRQVMTWSS